jgi:replicative DNA helicase
MSKIDLDFFEKILFQQILKKDNTFLASCVDHLDKELFKNKDFGVIVGIIKEFYLERDAIPTHTELKARVNTSKVKDQLEKAIKEIKDLDKEYDEDELIANTEYWLKQRKTDLILSKAIEEKVADKAVDLDAFQKENEKISNISLIDDLGLDYFGDQDKVIKYLLEKDTLISTGYKVVDDAFSGGMHKEGRSIYCIAGSTNVGKSLMVANIVTNVIKQGFDSVIITLEMSEKRYAKRISGILTGIALSQLDEKIENYKEYIQDFISDNKSRLIIKEFAAKSVTAGNIKAFIQRLERKKNFDPRLIALDYHTLCKTTRTNIPKHDEFQYLTQEARGLSYVFEAPLITPAQLNRDGHRSNGADLDNMAGSYAMQSDFDNVTVMSQSDEDREQNRILVRGKKARDGAINGGGYLKVDYDTLRFYEEGVEIKEKIKQLENMGADLDFTEFLDQD